MANGTPIGRVRGLGSAHEGAHHWLSQRFTAIGNLVLVSFLVISLALQPAYDHATLAAWAGQIVVATALALLVVNVFLHARLGVQVMIEDYVHTPGNKFAAIALLNVAVVAGIAFGLISLARIVFTGS